MTKRMPPAEDRPFDDVRMRGFAARSTVAEALRWLDSKVQRVPCEQVPLLQAAGRVLSGSVTSECDVPPFDRAMMDGVALKAEDTRGASATNRLALQLNGEILPGRVPDVEVKSGQAIRIMTGACLPRGATAVLPAEKIEWFQDRILVLDEVAEGKNIGRRGEDISAGDSLLAPGRVLRPQDIGVLSSIGINAVTVVAKPRVRIVITGNELLPAGSPPHGQHIADANGPMLDALVRRDGGIPIASGIVPDEPDAILSAMLEPADMVIVSGGSSVGQEDYAPTLVARHGELPIHGIAMRPSGPTGLGLIRKQLIVLLPGNPVSCLCGYDFFAGRAIRMAGGRPIEWPYRTVSLELSMSLGSAFGRLDYARVKIVGGKVEPISIAGASVLSSTTRADGFVIIPEDCDGYPTNAMVTVYLYD